MQIDMDLIKNRHLTEGDTNNNGLRDEWHEKNTDATALEWLGRDASAYIHQALSTPCLQVLESCEGIYITDISGKKYMDFHGNNIHQLGYRNPYILGKITEQMGKLPFSPRRFTNIPAIKAAEKLQSLSPGNLNKVLFTPGGASSIGLALKIARLATGRYKTISMWDSFHGASLEAITVGGESMFRQNTGPLMPGSEHVPYPDKYRGIFTVPGENWDAKYAEYIEFILEREGDVAAIIAEPIRNTSVSIPTRAFWKRVRAACDKHGTLLIFDEIPTFLGRTGRLFACENFDVTPDILVIGKALGGGVIPFSAVMVNDELQVPAEKSIGHYTFEKSPLGAVAALASFEYYENEGLEEKVKHLEGVMQERLTEMFYRYPLIGAVRGVGLLWAIELVKDRNTKEPATEQANKILYECLVAGLSFKVSQGNIITLAPPLVITESELNRALDIIETSLKGF
jgi:4-aminobutyrate aminotransferase